MLEDDGDIVRGLGFVSLYSAYLEERIDQLLFMLGSLEEYTKQEQRWPVKRKIKKAKKTITKIEFEGLGDLLVVLDWARDSFEARNEMVHGRIYGNYDRPDTLKSGRPDTPDRTITSLELYALANRIFDIQNEVFRPMMSEIPRALASGV